MWKRTESRDAWDTNKWSHIYIEGTPKGEECERGQSLHEKLKACTSHVCGKKRLIQQTQ